MRPFFAVESWLARRRYKRRDKARFNRMFPVRWFSETELIRQELALFHEETGGNHVNQEFISQLEKSKAALEVSLAKIRFINISIFLFLLLNYMSINVSVNIFGFSIKNTAGLTEALLAFVAAISAITIPIRLNYIRILNVIAAAMDIVYPKEMKPFYQAMYRPDTLPIQFLPQMSPFLISETVTRRVVLISSLSGSLLAIIALLTLIPLKYIIIANSYFHPEANLWINRSVLLFVVVLDVFEFVSAMTMYLPLPRRDWFFNTEIEALQQTHPDRAQERINDAYRDGRADRAEMQRRGYLPVEPTSD